MGEGLTKAAARNIFYGGSIFFFLVFAAFVAHSHYYATTTSIDVAGLNDAVARGTFYLDGHKPDDDKRTYILSKEEMQHPHSVLICPKILFEVHLPPRAVVPGSGFRG